jgi:hypothetical protein
LVESESIPSSNITTGSGANPGSLIGASACRAAQAAPKSDKIKKIIKYLMFFIDILLYAS